MNERYIKRVSEGTNEEDGLISYHELSTEADNLYLELINDGDFYRSLDSMITGFTYTNIENKVQDHCNINKSWSFLSYNEFDKICKDIFDYYLQNKQESEAYDKATKEKESKMKPNTYIKIESKVFINDCDLSEYDEDSLFKLISDAENEIKTLELIENKPKSLLKRTESRKKEIAALVKVMNEKK